MYNVLVILIYIFIQKIIQNLPFQGQTQLKGGQYCKILICYQEILLMFDYNNTYVNAVPKKSMNSYKFHGTDIYHFIELNAIKASIYNYTFLYEN